MSKIQGITIAIIAFSIIVFTSIIAQPITYPSEIYTTYTGFINQILRINNELNMPISYNNIEIIGKNNILNYVLSTSDIVTKLGPVSVQAQGMSDPQVFLITAPVVSPALLQNYVSFSAGNYDGIPVVIYKAGKVSMPNGMTLNSTIDGASMIVSTSDATLTGLTIYAANITATASVLGISLTITITPQNVNTLSILAEIASQLLPLYNVKIYAYYVNATSMTASNLKVIAK